MPQEILKQLGFSDKEAKIYLAILHAGKTTPTQIAKETGINRTTVYSVASDLIKKGIIAEDLGSTKTYLVALPLQDLANLTKQEEEKLDIQKNLITQAITQLQEATKDAPYHIPKLIFISEEQLENYLYSRLPIWSESLLERDGIFWGFQDHTFATEYVKWIDWQWKQPFSQNVSLNMLTNESEFETKIMKPRDYNRRNLLFWKKGANFQSSTWVNGDYVVFVNTRQHPFYLIELYDKTIADSMRHLFKGIWDEIESKKPSII
ncbi:MAG: helix-turn-helix domain-containing protein [bacterium]|nr:helix-turn-helix domain-containing protein [bacterium]